MLLAIDTATRTLGLAIHDGQKLLAEQTWQTPNNHTMLLAPAIEQLAENAGTTLDALTAFAVATGPGSYTGVRIGVALAKGMASARSLPLVGVTTLDTLAAAQPRYNGALVALVRAGRSRVIVGTYRWSQGRWLQRGEPRLMNWPQLFESIDGAATLAGEIDSNAHEALKAARAEQPELRVEFAPPVYNLRRAGFMAEIAWQRLKDGEPSSFAAARLAPLYMKQPGS